jgi:VanZ family protein
VARRATALTGSRALAWAAVALWAAGIFAVSSLTRHGPPLDTLHVLLRKAAHVTEYAVLTLLVVHALVVSGVQRPRSAALLIVLAYAASDEYHQTFVSGRSGTPRDVAIDLLGILLALGVCSRRVGFLDGASLPR